MGVFKILEMSIIDNYFNMSLIKIQLIIWNVKRYHTYSYLAVLDTQYKHVTEYSIMNGPGLRQSWSMSRGRIPLRLRL